MSGQNRRTFFTLPFYYCGGTHIYWIPLAYSIYAPHSVVQQSLNKSWCNWNPDTRVWLHYIWGVWNTVQTNPLHCLLLHKLILDYALYEVKLFLSDFEKNLTSLRCSNRGYVSIIKWDQFFDRITLKSTKIYYIQKLLKGKTDPTFLY